MEYLISAFEWFFIAFTAAIALALVLTFFGIGKITISKFNKPDSWIMLFLYIISIFVYFLN